MEDRRDAAGIVFNVQRFSLHDGPGIRTLFFLKGCPLRCVWCANPEGMTLKNQVLYDRSKCQRCGACMASCPEGAVKEQDGLFPTDQELCMGCGACVAACRYGARSSTNKRMTAGEVVALCLRDRVFYRNNVGGLTLGGGEPLLQADFALATIEHAKASGLHTAIETCACVKTEVYAAAVETSDIVYTDIKAVDDDLHTRITGTSNKPILKNISEVASGSKGDNVIFRIPLIQGVNDMTSNIRSIGEYILSLNREHKVEILLFHNFGEAKYEKLNVRYPFFGLGNMKEDEATSALETLSAMGIKARIS